MCVNKIKKKLFWKSLLKTLETQKDKWFHSNRTTKDQPSEPRFLASLQRQFADFPYLHWSSDQRLLTLETCCGYEYGQDMVFDW